jgi:hypothetical protein
MHRSIAGQTDVEPSDNGLYGITQSRQLQNIAGEPLIKDSGRCAVPAKEHSRKLFIIYNQLIIE